MAYSYTYYSDTKNHGGWNATMQVSCGHELVTTNDTVTIKMEGAAQYSSNNATGYGVHVQVGHDAVSSPSYAKRQADGYGVLNYSNWVGSAKGSFAFSRTHSAYNVWIWSAAWGETVSGYGAAPESAGGGKTITIPAKPSYSVTFNANGGSGAPSAQTKWYNESLTLSSTKPTRTNYVFKNWNTKSDGTGTAYASGASYTGNAALALYAQWYAPYTVSFNANGGSGAPSNQTKVYNTTLKLSTTKPTRTGYTFKNWNTKSDGTGTSYASGANYTANAAVTLYAIWQINTWAVTYDGNGATGGSTASQTKTYGQALALRSNGFTKTNHNFVKWNTAANGSGTSYNAGASYTGNAALKLYAQWRVAHSNPTISNLSVKRCTSDGTENVEGTRMKVDAAWSVDNTTSGFEDTVGSTFKVTLGGTTDTVNLSGTSGTVSFVHSATAAIGSSYTVTSVLADSKGYSTTKTSTLSVAYFTMHFKAGGTGVGIGKPSTVDNLLDVGMPLQLNADSSNFVGIKTKTANYTGTPIRVYGADDANGDALVMGVGGMVVLGAGESPSNLYSALGLSPGDESLHLAADGTANLYAACQTVANRTRLQLGVGTGNHVGAPAVRTDAAANSKVAIGTSSNNGVSVDTNLFTHYTYDKNGFWTSCYINRTDASGGVLTSIGVQNKKTDGTNVANYFNIFQRKDGSRGYSITDPAAFRDALSLNTWTSVAVGEFITFTSGAGWSSVTTTIRYNSALGIVRIYANWKTSTAKTAGNYTIGTVASTYRPKSMAVSIPTITSASQNAYLDTGGAFKANLSAISANGTVYFVGEYHIGT